nr:immunoglobulin heavy chain junction region [Macaca mulatta]MOW79005.1 immunoglobulin heavy chain junction region [Macaca mulatta]MOW79853.1 immunoglobulin heavy chain junction region [Macaca mulatta]MOW79964.1 immunoglobulin heavy chain junction region [Macaca mulatta]MOW83526.1 immunoglobulin heavy chain junction region [Macaca mulatta]
CARGGVFWSGYWEFAQW